MYDTSQTWLIIDSFCILRAWSANHTPGEIRTNHVHTNKYTNFTIKLKVAVILIELSVIATQQQI